MCEFLFFRFGDNSVEVVSVVGVLPDVLRCGVGLSKLVEFVLFSDLSSETALAPSLVLRA